MFPNCLKPGLVHYGINSFKRVQIKAMKRANSKTGLANTGTNNCIEKLVCIVCAYEFSSLIIYY